MGQITSLFAWKIIRQVDDSLDKRTLLKSIGIDPEGPVDPAVMIAAAEYYDFLERIAATDPRAIDLPLRTGASMRCDDYGAFGLAWKSARTLRGSFRRAERYARVLTSVSSYEVEETADGAFMHLQRAGERRLGLRLSNEASIASVVSISQQVANDKFQPNAIFFRHPPPSDISAHEAHFGCPVYFASDRDAVLVPSDQLDRPNRLGDRAISRFFDAHLEAELSRFPDDSALGQRVRIQVSRSLSEGVPTVSDIAARLGMSARTLQRRLAGRGHTFQALVDEARRQLAEQLLRDTDYPLVEIAFLTGFSEQSAFNRAFKRWAGQTPRSYRLQA